MIATTYDKQATTQNEFTQIRDLLVAPVIGTPLPANRKWILRCPNQKTLADYPESKEKLEKWQKEWTSCETFSKPQAKDTKPASQSSKATSKK